MVRHIFFKQPQYLRAYERVWSQKQVAEENLNVIAKERKQAEQCLVQCDK